MNYTIRPSAEIEVTKAPTIALAGPTGSGKTESALRIARGYVGPQGKFCVIDTEEKRALYKKGRYQPWDWLDFQPPFSPMAYKQVLEAAQSYQAVVLDSGSHEWAGDGGCQDMQADALERMSKGDAGRAERLSPLAWRDAKLEHKRFMAQLIRYPVLLIVCLRAEPKIKFIKDQQGKTQIVDAGYQPICEKMFGYEMLIFAMMHSDNPGVPVHLKKLERDLEPVFIEGEQANEHTGSRLAQWATGNTNAAARPSPSASSPVGAPSPDAAAATYITPDQLIDLEDKLSMRKIDKTRLLKAASDAAGQAIPSLAKLPADWYQRSLSWLERQR